MKRIILALLIFYTSICSAQKWCPPGATWKYYYGVWDNNYNTLVYEKDTIILNKLCKKISGKSILNGKAPFYTYAINDTVFMYNENEFKAVYFFNCKVGDTLSFGTIKFCDDEKDLKQVVESVGTTIINNDTLRYYIVKFINYSTLFLYPEKMKIMERVGIIESYFYPLFFCAADYYSYYLNCYHDDQFADYKTGPNANCNKTDTENIDIIELNIFPNPTSDKIIITSTSLKEIQTILIYDFSGKRCKTINNNINISNSQIDVRNLQNGMYIIQITTFNGKTFTTKFLKE